MASSNELFQLQIDRLDSFYSQDRTICFRKANASREWHYDPEALGIRPDCVDQIVDYEMTWLNAAFSALHALAE